MACSGQVLSEAEIQEKLSGLEGWQISAEGRLSRRYDWPKKKKDSFARAKAFIDKVSEVAEGRNHHPELHFGWGYAVMEFYTHTVNGITSTDFEMAILVESETKDLQAK
ncbi:unnamed protein product [Vitrella brassicaformis CCMP3155]|uniref:4a-hydroxytetrahydrobiopterin dehydratase n=1 Tax=Vitrella brassicaformis (strain CCMP3155) TaxID=1169540 RepID=A0A0G4F8E6_VITBC|nr:unnamed protein product [Vitrella brassicaformis CCMP3155]|eukprot:CEM08651.1 unnamed protein product [Vitrella brassicaformis CCMP3155]